MNHRGLLMCTRYAFAPNSLHYCGPEEQNNIRAYQQEQKADHGLQEIIEKFETLYPYLSLIAYANNIKDPFDPRVVEAYWIGNSLLNNVSMNKFYYHLRDTLKLKKKIKPKDLEIIFGKLDEGMIPHHTFHVLNIFTRTGHHSVEHTLETMDACRIGWGEIVHGTGNREQGTNISCHPELDSGSIQVKTKPLIYKNGKLNLGKSIIKSISVPFETKPTTYNLQPTTFVSFHWNTLCDIIIEEQATQLKWYTQRAIELANNTF